MSSASVRVDTLPVSIEGFVAMRDRTADTPEGGAAVMVMALLAYAKNEALGQQCLAVAVDRQWLEEGPGGYRGYRLRTPDVRRIRTQMSSGPHIPRSYIRGTNPENGYRLPESPYVLDLSASPYSGDPASGMVKVFVVSSGASNPRPVTVRRNNRGVWKAYEWSSLTMGVVPPVQGIDDDL
jgi:hypothetical protein